MNREVPEIDPAKCTGCGDCVDEGPTGAVELVEDKAVIVRPADCSYCAGCESTCSFDAIQCPYEIILAEEGRTA